MTYRDEGGDGGHSLRSGGTPKITRDQSEAKGRTWNGLSRKASEGINVSHTVSSEMKTIASCEVVVS